MTPTILNFLLRNRPLKRGAHPSLDYDDFIGTARGGPALATHANFIRDDQTYFHLWSAARRQAQTDAAAQAAEAADTGAPGDDSSGTHYGVAICMIAGVGGPVPVPVPVPVGWSGGGCVREGARSGGARPRMQASPPCTLASAPRSPCLCPRHALFPPCSVTGPQARVVRVHFGAQGPPGAPGAAERAGRHRNRDRLRLRCILRLAALWQLRLGLLGLDGGVSEKAPRETEGHQQRRRADICIVLATHTTTAASGASPGGAVCTPRGVHNTRRRRRGPPCLVSVLVLTSHLQSCLGRKPPRALATAVHTHTPRHTIPRTELRVALRASQTVRF